MLFKVILSAVFIFCYSLVYILDKFDIKGYARKYSIFNIPTELRSNSEIKSIISRYKNKHRIVYYTSIIITILATFLSTELYFAAIIAIVDVWLVCIMISTYQIHKKIDEYVKQNEISFKESEVEICTFKYDKNEFNTKVIKSKYFILPILFNIVLSSILLIRGKLDLDIFLIMNVIYIISSILVLSINRNLFSQKYNLYSTDKHVNLRINIEERGNLSRLLFLTNLVETFIFAAIWIFFAIYIPVTLLFIFITVTAAIVMVFAILNVKKRQSNILEIDESEGVILNRTIDRSKVVLGGLFYYDKDNKKTMISNNYTNFVPNLATLGGKILGAIFGFGLIIMILLPIWFFISAFSDIDVDLNLEFMTFKYMEYTETIEYKDIESYEMLIKMPVSRAKVNGISTEDKKIGIFKIEHYGWSRLYITEDNLPVIYIRTNDKNFFINSSDKVDAKELYQKLKVLDGENKF